MLAPARWILAALLLLAGVPAASAAEPASRLFSRPALPAMYGVSRSVVADLTGDGVPDLVSAVGRPAQPGGLGISVMPGRAAGGFGPASRTPSGRSYTGLGVADIDADGKRDVVAWRVEPEGLLADMLAGTGGTELGPPVDLGLDPAVAIATGRFADGAVLAVADGSGVTYYRPGAAIRAGGRIPWDADVLAATDRDGDGIDELAAGTAAGAVRLYQGVTETASTQLPDLLRLEPAPWTASDAPRLVAATGSGRLFGLDGSLRTVRDVQGLDGVEAVVAGDVDGDGKVDLVRTNTDAVAEVIPAAGARIDVPLTAPATDLLVHDATGDGVADLLAVEPNANVVEVLEGGSRSFAPTRAPVQAGFDTEDLVLADLNGDGKVDMVSSEVEYGLVNVREAHVFLGDGTGRFTRSATLAIDGQPDGLAVTDVNGDGKPDVLIGDFQLGVSQFLGIGDGTFAPRTFVTPCRLVVDVVSGDFNGDTYGDVAVQCRASFYPEYVAILAGSPAGLRPSGVALTANPSDGRGLAAGDVNGDGRLDVVAGHYDGTIDILLQDAAGTFTALPRESAGRMPSLSLGDVNGDGRGDLVVPLPDAGEVWVRLSGPGGVAVSTETHRTFEHPGGAAIADLTADGKPDLIVGHGPNALSVAAGRGDGTFGLPWAYTSQAGLLGDVVVADVNGDGKRDVGAAQSSGAEIFIQGR